MPFPNQSQAKSVDTTALNIAQAESRDCVYCSGDGMVTVYAPGYTGDALAIASDGRKYVARTAAHCRCPLGRFIRASAHEDVRRMTPEVDMICQGRSRWLLDDPSEAIGDLLVKDVDPNAPVDPGAFQAFWGKTRGGQVAKRIPGSSTKTTAEQIKRDLEARRERKAKA